VTVRVPFRRRRPVAPSVSARLLEVLERNVALGRFTPAELDLVMVSGPDALVRVPRAASGVGQEFESTVAARSRLEEAGFLRTGPPRAGEAATDQVAATLVETGETVTLYGDYAIVVALTGRPAVLAEVRWADEDGAGESRFFSGNDPTVVLQELPLGDGWLAYRLYRADRGVVGILGLCGMELDDPDRTPAAPPRVRLPAGEVRAGFLRWAELRLARPAGGRVEVTGCVAGRYEDGLWMIDGPVEGSEAVWYEPKAFGDRIAGLLAPPEGSGTWLDAWGPDTRRSTAP